MAKDREVYKGLVYQDDVTNIAHSDNTQAERVLAARQRFESKKTQAAKSQCIDLAYKVTMASCAIISAGCLILITHFNFKNYSQFIGLAESVYNSNYTTRYNENGGSQLQQLANNTLPANFLLEQIANITSLGKN